LSLGLHEHATKCPRPTTAIKTLFKNGAPWSRFGHDNCVWPRIKNNVSQRTVTIKAQLASKGFDDSHRVTFWLM